MSAQTSLLIGRDLKTLTPAELEELLKLANVRAAEMGPSDDSDEDDGPSMHPTLPMFYRWPGGEFDEEARIMFTTLSKGEEDDSSTECWIEVGEIWLGWGPACSLPVVKWFLDHGWSWSVPVARDHELFETFKEGLHQAKFECQAMRADLGHEQQKYDRLRTVVENVMTDLRGFIVQNCECQKCANYRHWLQTLQAVLITPVPPLSTSAPLSRHSQEGDGGSASVTKS